MTVGEAHVFVDDADIRHDGHGQTGADGDAVDGRDDGLVTVDDVQDDVPCILQGPRHVGIVAHDAPLHGDVTTGAEGLPCAGDDCDPGLRIGSDVEPDPGEV